MYIVQPNGKHFYLFYISYFHFNTVLYEENSFLFIIFNKHVPDRIALFYHMFKVSRELVKFEYYQSRKQDTIVYFKCLRPIKSNQQLCVR